MSQSNTNRGFVVILLKALRMGSIKQTIKPMLPDNKNGSRVIFIIARSEFGLKPSQNVHYDNYSSSQRQINT